MATQDWVLYATENWGTTASSLHNYFQAREGSTTALTKFLTNMRGDGNLPQSESFVIHRIEVYPDDDIAQADVLAWVQDSYIEITLGDRVVFQAPLRLVAGHNSYSGEFHEVTSSLIDLIGIEGEGYTLQTPIVIEGGVNFRVVLGQGTALSATGIGVKVALVGLLTTPD